MKKDAERLGIVYTPVEIVDFILASANHVLRHEFGRSLSDAGVHVLDPFTGTGIFLARLLESTILRDADLLRKYREELHANEIILLAYYIAAIHIEEAFRGRRGAGAAYEPFGGIVLTDTFNLYTERTGFPKEWLPDNSERAERQQKLPIQVIVGNPPWSAGQRSSADDNPNVDYLELERRVADTYAARSTATLKSSLYDTYKMAIRWASDRIGDQGLVAFVTNGSWITAVPLGPYENGPGTPCAGMMGLVKPTENTGGTKPVAHNDTVFAQVLKLVPRHEFESLARKHKSGRMSRSMTRWGQFVAMGMAQLTGRCSLRDIVSNLAAQSCKLYHLGVGVVTRSSLARVNAEKPWEMYEELHGRLLGRCQAKAPGHGYRFKAKLFSVDSTTIDLCLSAFPWAKFRRTKGAVKVHVGLDHEGYLPTFVRVTNGKTSDIEAARALTLPKGSIVAADRAYVDFAWIDSLISEGIHLVTRLKRGIQYGVVETREVNAKRGVTSDETIEFTSAKGRKQCPHRLRRIGYHDRKTGKDYVFLTTHFHLSAKTIADIYKSRWQVELFFKWIKQNLKVKSFVGTSRNAVMTQVWTAMCIYLILSYIKFANRIAWRLSEILRLLQLNLFERRPLRELLGSGNESPPDRSSQLTMKFTWT